MDKYVLYEIILGKGIKIRGIYETITEAEIMKKKILNNNFYIDKIDDFHKKYNIFK